MYLSQLHQFTLISDLKQDLETAMAGCSMCFSSGGVARRNLQRNIRCGREEYILTGIVQIALNMVMQETWQCDVFLGIRCLEILCLRMKFLSDGNLHFVYLVHVKRYAQDLPSDF